MSITEKTIIIFDPVKDYRVLTSWASMNNMTEWKKNESTAAIAFVREQTTFFEAAPPIIEAEEEQTAEQ